MEEATKITPKVRKKQAPGKKLTRGPAKGLTVKEREFADLILRGESGKDAALEVYNTDNPISATSIASQVLAKPDVRAYLESVSGEAAEIVMKHARGAQSEMVSLMAARDILDRTGFKTPEPAKDPNQGATYNFLFSAETQESVRAIEATIRARLTGTHNETNDVEETPTHVEVIEKGSGQTGFTTGSPAGFTTGSPG